MLLIAATSQSKKPANSTVISCHSSETHFCRWQVAWPDMTSTWDSTIKFPLTSVILTATLSRRSCANKDDATATETLRVKMKRWTELVTFYISAQPKSEKQEGKASEGVSFLGVCEKIFELFIFSDDCKYWFTPPQWWLLGTSTPLSIVRRAVVVVVEWYVPHPNSGCWGSCTPLPMVAVRLVAFHSKCDC